MPDDASGADEESRSLIYFHRDRLEEALAIYEQKQLPVYERLGAVRELLVAQASQALTHLRRNANGDREQARHLLCLALQAAESLAISEADSIREILAQHDLTCPA